MTDPQRSYANLFGLYKDGANTTLSEKLRTGFSKTGFTYSFIKDKIQ